MKIKRYTPAFIALAAIIGAVLRGRNLISGYEPGTRLPIPGNMAQTALVALTIFFIIALTAISLLYRSSRGIRFEDAFSQNTMMFKTISVISGLIMVAAGALGVYFSATGTAGEPFFSVIPLIVLWLLAILTGICFIGIAIALSRNNITASTASLMIIPMFWSCFDLIITFKDNGSSPFIGLYGFELLAAIALTYAFYSLAGFLYAVPRPGRFVFSSGMSFILCMTCVGGFAISLLSGATVIVPTVQTVLRYACFFGSSIWLFALYVILTRSIHARAKES